jgi:hypothetical protein
MDRIVGGDLPAKIWHDYVEEAVRIMSRPVAAAAVRQSVASSGTNRPAENESTPSPEPTGILRGRPTVADTATLVFRDGIAHLSGVEGEKGAPARELVRYIRGREVACEPTEPGTTQYRCKVENIDLGEAVVLNGAGRAAADASERLLDAEEKAQLDGRGIWHE